MLLFFVNFFFYLATFAWVSEMNQKNSKQKSKLTKPKKPVKAAKSAKAPTLTKARKQTIPANLELREKLTIELERLLKELVKAGVKPGNLPKYLVKAYNNLIDNLHNGSITLENIPPYRVMLQTFETAYLTTILNLCDGHKRRAQQTLGIPYRTFLRVLTRHNLNFQAEETQTLGSTGKKATDKARRKAASKKQR